MREAGRPFPSRRRLQVAAGVAAAALILAVVITLWNRPAKRGELVVHKVNASVAEAAPVKTFSLMSSVGRLENKPGRSLESAVKGVNALGRRWQARPFAVGKRVKSVADLERIAGKQGFRLSRFGGGVDTLLRADLPALLELRLPGNAGTRYLAVTAFRDGKFQVTPSLAGRSTLGRDELAAIWKGEGYLLWKNYQRIPVVIQPGARKVEVLRLQILLMGAGFYSAEPSGVFDQTTVSALRDFQASRGLSRDGAPGARTLALLYRDAGNLQVPRLIVKGEEKRP